MRPKQRSDKNLAPEIHAIAWEWRWRIFLGAMLGITIAAVYMVVTDRYFIAEVTAVPAKHDEVQVSGFDIGGAFGALRGLGGGGTEESKTALALLRTRGFIESFIHENEMMPILFHEDWDQTAGQWRNPDNAPTLWKGYRKFHDEVLSVVENVNVGVIYIRVSWTDPTIAAHWANSIVEKVNAAVRSHAVSEADASLRFLTEELSKTDSIEARQGIYKLMEAQISRRMLANVRPDYALRAIDLARSKSIDEHDYPKALIVLPAGFMFGVSIVLLLILIKAFIIPVQDQPVRGTSD